MKPLDENDIRNPKIEYAYDQEIPNMEVIELERIREIVRYLGQCTYENGGVLVLDWFNVENMFGKVMK